MYTVTDILQDTQRGCALYNMVEDKFSSALRKPLYVES